MLTMRYALLILLAGGLAWYAFSDAGPTTAAPPEAPVSVMAEVTVPNTLSEAALAGKPLYDANCAACHGPDAAGQESAAPPLVHIYYEPSHHADEAIQRAVALGVRQHHWSFGDMPPVEGLSREDVTQIIAYIRELQRANGIE